MDLTCSLSAQCRPSTKYCRLEASSHLLTCFTWVHQKHLHVDCKGVSTQRMIHPMLILYSAHSAKLFSLASGSPAFQELHETTWDRESGCTFQPSYREYPPPKLQHVQSALPHLGTTSSHSPCSVFSADPCWKQSKLKHWHQFLFKSKVEASVSKSNPSDWHVT